jgi:hypothetical protein
MMMLRCLIQALILLRLFHCGLIVPLTRVQALVSRFSDLFHAPSLDVSQSPVYADTSFSNRSVTSWADPKFNAAIELRIAVRNLFSTSKMLITNVIILLFSFVSYSETTYGLRFLLCIFQKINSQVYVFAQSDSKAFSYV